MAIGEVQRDFKTAEVNQCWLVVTGMAQWCSTVGAGLDKAANVTCLAVFDLGTNSALSRLLGSAKKKSYLGRYGPAHMA